MILAVTGHRPDKLGGYVPSHPLRDHIRSWFQSRITELAPSRAISGMAQGVDQDFALVCTQLGVPWVAAVPCKAQASKWSKEAQSAYMSLLELADDVVVLSDDGVPWAEAMQVRNEYLVDTSDRMLAVWDGSHGGTGSTVRLAKKAKRQVDFFDWDEMKRWAISSGLADRVPTCECATSKCPCAVVWHGFVASDDRP